MDQCLINLVFFAFKSIVLCVELFLFPLVKFKASICFKEMTRYSLCQNKF